jgi:hypothetical protein
MNSNFYEEQKESKTFSSVTLVYYIDFCLEDYTDKKIEQFLKLKIGKEDVDRNMLLTKPGLDTYRIEFYVEISDEEFEQDNLLAPLVEVCESLDLSASEIGLRALLKND